MMSVMGGPYVRGLPANIDYLGLGTPSVTTRRFSLGDSESAGTLLARIGLHPRMTFEGYLRSMV